MSSIIRCPALIVVCQVAMLAGSLGCAGTGGSALIPARRELLSDAEYLRDCGPGPGANPRELSKTVLSEYILEPGDGLLIEPIRLDSPLRFPIDQVILADGTIDLGQYGRPVVAGRTIPQVERIVAQAIQLHADEELDEAAREVNVRLIDPQSKVYYVLGEVLSPGAYPLRGRETLLDAILAAGGLSDRASTCDIILSRPTAPGSCRIVLPVCYDQIVQLGDTTTNYQIQPGDRIFVASRCWLDCLRPFKKRGCDHCCQRQCPCPCGVTMAPPTFYAMPPQIVYEICEPWAIPSIPTAPQVFGVEDGDQPFPLEEPTLSPP